MRLDKCRETMLQTTVPLTAVELAKVPPGGIRCTSFGLSAAPGQFAEAIS